MSSIQIAEAKLIEEGNSETAETLASFENRWRFAVFPAMVAFIVLSGFGFYLIYGMLQRMEQLATDVSHLTAVIAKSLPAMQSNVSDISNKITVMSTEMKAISHSTSSLASSTQQMGVNVWEMNNNISKPLSLMNKMIPFARNVAPTSAPIQYQQGNPFYSNTRKVN